LTIRYRDGAIEDLAAASEQFDVVCALEIIEHTADAAGFVAALDAVVKPGGMIIMSTLNRTARSYALGIVAAEWVLGWVPRGTHQWRKFVRPSELAEAGRRAGWSLRDLSGLSFDPIRNRWALSADLGINYLAAFAKPASEVGPA
jgi:2-polyprenyl-6-hydroxyphenyl methylase/3-demethylubiquinone-9 3-methyltransferase